MCRGTFLGPVFGEPLKSIKVVPRESLPKVKHHRYLAFSCRHKIGLQILPPTGNPYESVAMIGHPFDVLDFVLSFDGLYMFTTDGKCIVKWKINTSFLESVFAMGGSDLSPFLELLVTKDGMDIYNLLQKVFYFFLIHERESRAKKIENKLPISYIPHLMRALGFYPTEKQIEDMVNEVQYRHFETVGALSLLIDFDTTLKLFINHRPFLGLKMEDVERSFEVLGDMKKDAFSRLLKNEGLTLPSLSNYEPAVNSRRENVGKRGSGLFCYIMQGRFPSKNTSRKR